MKRGGNLKRTAALTSDPAKRAAFIERGRGGFPRSRAATPPSDFRDDAGRVLPLQGGWLTPRPSNAPKGGRVPAPARKAAFARTHGACITCSARAAQVHHVLPRNKWPHLAKLAANLVGICAACHDEHERAHRRIPRALLPAAALALAEAEGLTWYIERTYPAPRP